MKNHYDRGYFEESSTPEVLVNHKEQQYQIALIDYNNDMYYVEHREAPHYEQNKLGNEKCKLYVVGFSHPLRQLTTNNTCVNVYIWCYSHFTIYYFSSLLHHITCNCSMFPIVGLDERQECSKNNYT